MMTRVRYLFLKPFVFKKTQSKVFKLLITVQVKRHTTFTEAVQVAQEMEAKNAIMTHFSQRYAKIPTLEEFEEAENVGIGK